MRRRSKLATNQNTPPPGLVHYRAADWTGVGCHPECAYWEAVEEWRNSIPHDEDGLPGGPLLFDGPAVPFQLAHIGDRWVDEAHDAVI